MANPEKREKARELRRQGWRITDIAKELDAHKDVIREWCRDIELTDKQIEQIAENNPKWRAQHIGAQKIKLEALTQRLKYQLDGREHVQQGSLLYLMGAMLYWGEGAKHRQRMRFTNTDANMLKLFMKYLRQELNVPDDKFIIRVMTHSENQDEWLTIEEYWRNLLELPQATKIQLQLKIGTQSRKKRYPYGICAIDVYSIEIVQKIFGAIQEYIGFENPKWVE